MVDNDNFPEPECDDEKFSIGSLHEEQTDEGHQIFYHQYPGQSNQSFSQSDYAFI